MKLKVKSPSSSPSPSSSGFTKFPKNKILHKLKYHSWLKPYTITVKHFVGPLLEEIIGYKSSKTLWFRFEWQVTEYIYNLQVVDRNYYSNLVACGVYLQHHKFKKNRFELYADKKLLKAYEYEVS